MNEKEFVYWLQGFFELSGAEQLDQTQVKMIKEHLQLVFEKKTQTAYEQPKKPYTIEVRPNKQYLPTPVQTVPTHQVFEIPFDLETKIFCDPTKVGSSSSATEKILNLPTILSC